MAFERFPVEDFAATFGNMTELSSVALGGSVVAVSDEFFADASHLLRVEPAPSLKGQFGTKGALFSGWETRRHNPAYDWCIIKLGTTGSILGFDIDTTHFNGNEAPQVSVEATYSSNGSAPKSDDPNWTEILTTVDLGPNSRHLFRIANVTDAVNFVKLNMYPDGGIARFRVYGQVLPVFPPDPSTVFDLAHVFAGGQVILTSDQHFGVGSNLILPGRGKNMGDGWETKRSRQRGHKDWVIIKLGNAGILSHVEIDTAHFKGNFPESCELHAVYNVSIDPINTIEEEWALILPRMKLGPHRQHYFQLENVEGKPYTHVRITIYPDGGIKRVRLLGRRFIPNESTSAATPYIQDSTEKQSAESKTIEIPTPPSGVGAGPIIPALPLTPEAFIPFGRVIQSYTDINAVPSPRTTRITGANQGTATKFHKLALLESSYPSDVGASAGLSVYRCKPIDVPSNGEWEVKLLERHPCTNQAFIPMGSGNDKNVLGSTAPSYLVIVAHNGEDDKPDLRTMRAFIASAAQGIQYNTGIWHHPMAVLDKPLDLTCVETQIGDGNALDCEVVELDGSSGFHRIKLPSH